MLVVLPIRENVPSMAATAAAAAAVAATTTATAAATTTTILKSNRSSSRSNESSMTLKWRAWETTHETLIRVSTATKPFANPQRVRTVT